MSPCLWRWAWTRLARSSSSPLERISCGEPLAATLPCSSTNDAVGDVFDDLELMSGGDDGLRGALPLLDEVDELALAAGIEHGGRFVEQQHLGIEHNDRGQGDPLLFAAGETIGRAVAKMRNAHQLQAFR